MAETPGYRFKIIGDSGGLLDATVELEPGAIIVLSRGGTRGTPGASNQDYAAALRLMLRRLLASRRVITGVWVDSLPVQSMSRPDRQILDQTDFPADAETIFSLLGRRMERIGKAPGSDPEKGNRNKRIRIELAGGSVEEITSIIGAKPDGEAPRTAARSPSDGLNKVAQLSISLADDTRPSGAGITKFELGRLYDRDRGADILNLPDAKRVGNWLTGYSRQGSEFFIFANVGVAGRTGHNYANQWQGKQLIWMARGNAALGQPELTDLLSGNFPVHVFWRGRERGGFTYAGRATSAQVSDTRPVQVIWEFLDTRPTSSGPGPRVRRGPPPLAGLRTTVRSDAETHVYLMSLEGPVSAAFPGLYPGQKVVKVGMSNDPDRRLEDLSCGFPPGCALGWKLIATRSFPSGSDAFTAEGALLDHLRLTENWIGGEFAVVTQEQFDELKKLGS